MKRVLALLALAGCSEQVGHEALDIVHGDDDRRDYYEVEEPRLRELTARSVTALVRHERIDATDPNDVRLTAPTLGEIDALCENQRFGADPTAARCSGTLIGDDLVLTAAHCLSDGACAELSFVFGYYREGPETLHRIEAADVFRCQEVVASVDGPIDLGDGQPLELDWAVARLERAATPRFLPVPVGEPLPQDAPLTVISFGAGLPAKIDRGSRVIDPRDDTRDFFFADSDTFAHSSGGGVFDRDGTVLVGLVARGAGDWETSEEGCRRARTCEGACEGHWPWEEMQYAFYASH